jgi:hypothetical protein
VANFPEPAGFPDALEIPSRTGRLRAEYAVNGSVYARRKAGHRLGPARARIGHWPNGAKVKFTASPGIWRLIQPRVPRGSNQKAAINGVLTQFYVFMKYLRLGSIMTRFALRSDRSLGIPER